MTDITIVAMRCRTCDRDAAAGRGAQALAETLGAMIERPARIVGSPERPRRGSWEQDLRAAHGCLLEAGGQVDDALRAGRLPLLCAGEGAVALTTLPHVLAERAAARVLWIDAHGAFHTPQTTTSSALAGMALAGACGRWDAGLVDIPGVDPARVALCGVRELDGPERVELMRSGVGLLEDPGEVAARLAGEEVYVHLDLDVVDPAYLPAERPAPGGMAPEQLRDTLVELAAEAHLVGIEVCGLLAPSRAEEAARLAAVVAGGLYEVLDAAGLVD